jgi:PAS domain S-box-containing protein
MAKENETDRIREILKINPKGLTIEEVSKKLSLNRATAGKYLNSLVISGQADMRTLGPAKLFYLTHRLPLNNLLSLATDLILILDNELYIQEANDSFLSFFGLSKEAMKGARLEHSPVASYLSEEQYAFLDKALDGSGSSHEARFEAVSDERFFMMKYIPLVFEGGARGVGIICEDITEMKKYQRELEKRVAERTYELVKAKEFAENLIETANAMVIGFDNQGIITIFNRAAEKVSGYSRDEMMNSAGFDIMVPRDRYPHVWEQLQSRSDGGVPQTYESPLITKSGEDRYISWQNSTVTESGQPILTISFGIDITEQNRIEEAIQKANKQILLMNSITRHDILNQLNVLSGYLAYMKKLIKDETAADLIQKEQDVAETIRRQITFTRDYQNIGNQPPQWNNVQQIVTRVLSTMDRGGVAVLVTTGNLEIYADLLIEKVFFNLIENALRHGVDVTEIRVLSKQEENRLVLVIEDNGTGIPDDEKEVIFERGHGKNTGYGLFLVREILSITGLAIKETGTSGVGARFEIIIPKGQFRSL